MAARPRTLPAAIAPVLVGTAAAIEQHGDLRRVGAFIAALIGSIFIQIGTNLANDYSDAKRGADTVDRLGPVRVTASGLVAPRSVLVATWVAFGVAVAAGHLPGRRRRLVIIVVGVASIAAGVLYTGGPRPYGYDGLGELFVFLFFGLVAVNGSYYVQLERLDWLPFGLSVAVGCLATAILVVNNVRDIETDRRAGKRTLAVRIGRRAARAASMSALVGAAYIALLVTLAGQRRALVGAARPGLSAAGLQPAERGADPDGRAGPERRPRRDRGAAGRLQPGGLRRAADRRLSIACGMRLEEIEVIPYSLPFREPYVTARGELERARADPGPDPRRGAGGARRDGVALAAGRSGHRRRSRQRSASAAGPPCWTAELDPRGSGRRSPRCRNRGASAQAVAAVDIALHDLVGRESGDPVWRLLGADRGSAGRLQRDPAGGQPRGDPRDGGGLGGRGLPHLQAQGRAGRRRRRRSPPSGRPSATRSRSGSTPTEPGASTTRPTGSRPSRITSIELAEQPVGTFEQMVDLRRRVKVRIAADESLVSPYDARRARELGACELAAVKVAKVGGLGAALEIAGTIPVVPVERAGGSGRDRGSGPRGAGAAGRGR